MLAAFITWVLPAGTVLPGLPVIIYRWSVSINWNINCLLFVMQVSIIIQLTHSHYVVNYRFLMIYMIFFLVSVYIYDFYVGDNISATHDLGLKS